MERGGSCCLQRWTDTFASHRCPSAHGVGGMGELGGWRVRHRQCCMQGELGT